MGSAMIRRIGEAIDVIIYRLGNIDIRLAALEARPTDPEISARVAALEAAMAERNQ